MISLGIFLWMPLCADVIWLVHCAQKWMAGGIPFSVDFEELNPPFNVALYLPLAWLVNHSTLPAAPTIALAVWMVMIGIYTLISNQLKHQEKSGILEQTTTQNLHIVTAIALFLIPAPEMGQKEHFLLAFTLPYLMLAAGQIQGMSMGLRYQLPIAGLAGLGFIIKPQTLMIPLFIEIFLAFQQRYFISLLNPRSIMMAAVCLAYGLWIYTAFPTYLTFYVPMLIEIYSSFGINEARVYIGLFVSLCVVLISGLYTLQAFRQGYFKPMHFVWLLSGSGFLIVTLWQGKFFLYHFFPFLGIVFILLGSFKIIQKERFVLLAIVITIFFYGYSGNFFFFSQTKNTLWHDLSQKTSVRRVTVLSAQDVLSDSLLKDPSLVYGSRYMSLWFGSWVLRSPQKDTSTQSKVFENYFLKTVGEDMIHYQPQLVFLENVSKNKPLLTWLKKNPSFQKEWEAFVPLKENFLDVFTVYIRRDIPNPEKVRHVIETTSTAFAK